jgi:WD40 repeat protein
MKAKFKSSSKVSRSVSRLKIQPNKANNSLRSLESKSKMDYIESKEQQATKTNVFGAMWPMWSYYHEQSINCVAISHDGSLIAAGDANSTLKIRSLLKGNPIQTWESEGQINDVAFSNDADYIAYGDNSKNFVVRQLSSGPEHFKKEFLGAVTSIAFSPNNTDVAVACANKTVTIINFRTEGQVLELGGEGGDVGFKSVCYSNDGNLLLCGGNDTGYGPLARKVTVHDLRADTKGQILSTFIYPANISCIALAPVDDHPRLAVGTSASLTLRDLNSGDMLCEFFHEGGILCIDWSPDAKYLACGDADFIRDPETNAQKSCPSWTTVRDVTCGGATVNVFEHEKAVKSIKFSGDGHLLVTGDNAKALTVRDMKGGTVSHDFQHNHELLTNGLNFSNDGRILMSADKSGAVVIRRVKHGNVMNTLEFAGHLSSVSMSPDATAVAVGMLRQNKIVIKRISRVKTTGRRDSVTGRKSSRTSEDKVREMYPVLAELSFESGVNVVKYSPCGKFLAGGDRKGNVRIYNVECLQDASNASVLPELIAEIQHGDGLIQDICWSPSQDGSGLHLLPPLCIGVVGMGGQDIASNTAVIYNAEKKEIIRKIEENELTDGKPGQLFTVDIDPTGKFISCGGTGKKTNIYEIEGGNVKHCCEHNQVVQVVRFSPNGKLIASGSKGNRLTIRSVETGGLVARYTMQDFVVSIDWSPDSIFIATGDCNRQLTVRYNPVIFQPHAVPSDWWGLMEHRPHLWRLPRPSDDDKNVMTTPLNDIDAACLESLVANQKIDCHFSTLGLAGLKNPRYPDMKPPVVSPLEKALEDQDHRKCSVLAELIQTDFDGDHTLAKWLGSLAGSNNILLVHILEHCIVPTENCASHERMFTLDDGTIKPFGTLDISWPFIKSTSFNIVQSKEDQPFYLFDNNEIESIGLTNAGMKRRSVETVAVGVPHFIKYAFPKIVEHGSIELFETEVMGYVVAYLWQHVRWLYYVTLTAFCSLALSFTAGHYLMLWRLENIGPETDGILLTCRILLYVSLLISGMFIFSELRQMIRKGPCVYIRSGWNVLELVSYTLVVVSVLWIELQLKWQNIVGSIALAAIWTASISQLRGLKLFGAIVATFVEIIGDMNGFMCLLAIFWLGGAMSFKVLLPGSPDFHNANALMSIWMMVLGDPIVDAFEITVAAIPNSTLVDTGLHGINTVYHANATAVVAKILSILFVFVIMIVLLNQLIALMGESYGRVMENYPVEIVRSRAKVILDLMDLYGHYLPNTIVYPKWLHVLRPVSAVNKDGHVKALKRELAETRALLVSKIEDQEDHMSKQMDKMNEDFEGKTDKMFVLLKQMHEMMVEKVEKEEI